MLFRRKSPFAKCMGKARAMIALARKDKAEGYSLAAKCAVQAALDFRRAAHAYRYYCG